MFATFLVPTNFDITKFNSWKLAVSYLTTPYFEKLLIFPEPKSQNPNYDNCTFFALSTGGELQGQSASCSKWVSCSSVDYFDDIIIFSGKVYGLDREGCLYVITVNSQRILTGKPVIDCPLTSVSAWRKRLVNHASKLYLVVRVEVNLLQVYRMFGEGKLASWSKVKGFEGDAMLNMSKDYFFFKDCWGSDQGSSDESDGSDDDVGNDKKWVSEYKDCIVFPEVAFPKYGNDGWEFSENDNDIAFFWFSDGTFAREGDENLPKLDCSPPPWIFHPPPQSDSDPVEDEDLDSSCDDEKDEEMESDSKIEDEKDEEDEPMQCDLMSQKKKDEEATGTILNTNCGNDATEQGTSSAAKLQQSHSSSLCDKQKPTKPPNKPVSLGTFHFNTITVYEVIHTTLFTKSLWITALSTSDSPSITQLKHPLTLKPYVCNLPSILDITKFNSYKLGVSYLTSPSFEKLLIFPEPKSPDPDYHHFTLVVLSIDGELRGQSPFCSKWVSCSSVDYFDDIIIFKHKVYGLDRKGCLYVITVKSKRITIGEPVIDDLLIPVSGWRKRLVTNGSDLFAVVRVEDNLLQVYMMSDEETLATWSKVQGFKGTKILYMSRDYDIFRDCWESDVNDDDDWVSDYKDCIVFPEVAFPKYGSDGWEFSENDGDIAVFWLLDETFAREGDERLPKLDCLPPSWIFHHSSQSCSQSDRAEAGEGLANSEDEQMQCDLTSLTQQDDEIPCTSNVGACVLLQGNVTSSLLRREFGSTDTVMTSVSAVKEVTRTFLNINGRNDETEQATPGRKITHSVQGACTFSAAKRHKSDSVTSKFEEFGIRSDLIPTLQMIWQKHGNIIENSIIRSDDILAKALESLAVVVQILKDNTAQSLSDSQANCLKLTLSDLRSLCFKVDWLAPFVEEALKLHESKPLLESIYKLSQESSRLKERRAILCDELVKLDDEENKLNEEIAKLLKTIPSSGKVKLDQPLGFGLI